MKKESLKIFTWHVHGTYLYYLSQGNFTFYIPVNEERSEGYYGRGNTFPFGDNVVEINAADVKNTTFDCILFQTNKNYLFDQHEILSQQQKSLPKIYVEHDTPAKYPADAKHIINDPNVLMVHVTNFNKLMWNNDDCSIVKVIDHGVVVPPHGHTGEIEKGVVIINHLHQRGRKLGADIFEKVSKKIPLDLIGMGTKEHGGLGEVLHPQMPGFIGKYRFCFNPIRWTSLGLAVLEAMAIGLPVVALATTEYVTVIQDGVNGFIHTDIDYLIEKMQWLLENKMKSHSLGNEARKTILNRFDIERFANDWDQVFHLAIQNNKLTYEEENSIH